MKPFTDTERQEFLAAKHVGVLSVAAADGRPPASVPIWYDYVPDGDIRVNTGAGTRKAKLIERAGAVTLVVQREEPPYQYVVVEGTVVETTTPTPTEVREVIAIRKASRSWRSGSTPANCDHMSRSNTVTSATFRKRSSSCSAGKTPAS